MLFRSTPHCRGQCQQRGGTLPYPVNFFQCLPWGFQHLGQGAEGIQQSLSHRGSVLPGHSIKEQKLQHLPLVEVVQAFLAEALAEPLPVSLMNRHIFPSDPG